MDKIHGLTPLENVNFLSFFKTSIFFYLKSFFSFYNIKNHLFWYDFCDFYDFCVPIKKSSIFGQNPWTNPFKKCPLFGPCQNFNFLFLQCLFSIQNNWNHFFQHNFCKKHPYEKFRFLDKVHFLWETSIFWPFF